LPNKGEGTIGIRITKRQKNLAPGRKRSSQGKRGRGKNVESGNKGGFDLLRAVLNEERISSKAQKRTAKFLGRERRSRLRKPDPSGKKGGRRGFTISGRNSNWPHPPGRKANAGARKVPPGEWSGGKSRKKNAFVKGGKKKAKLIEGGGGVGGGGVAGQNLAGEIKYPSWPGEKKTEKA